MAGDGAAASASAVWPVERLAQQGVRLRIVYVSVSTIAPWWWRWRSDELSSNLLVHGCLGEPIDVKKLALRVRNANYSPKVGAICSFRGVV